MIVGGFDLSVTRTFHKDH